ncbi:MAG: hypothetical protein R3B98_01515 [Hyphomonas sp.]
MPPRQNLTPPGGGVDDISMIDTSYPDFLSHMATLGADISEE